MNKKNKKLLNAAFQRFIRQAESLYIAFLNFERASKEVDTEAMRALGVAPRVAAEVQKTIDKYDTQIRDALPEFLRDGKSTVSTSK